MFIEIYHVNVTDNDVELGYDYRTYQEAVDECKRQGSFIKWYSDNACTSTAFPAYWTSGTRHDEIFVMRKACKKFSSP